MCAEADYDARLLSVVLAFDLVGIGLVLGHARPRYSLKDPQLASPAASEFCHPSSNLGLRQPACLLVAGHARRPTGVGGAGLAPEFGELPSLLHLRRPASPDPGRGPPHGSLTGGLWRWIGDHPQGGNGNRISEPATRLDIGGLLCFSPRPPSRAPPSYRRPTYTRLRP